MLVAQTTRIDFAFLRGSTLRFTQTWTNPDGSAADLAGWTFSMHGRPEGSDDGATATWTISSPASGVAIASNVATFTVALAFAAGNYEYDTKSVDAGGVVRYAQKGVVAIEENVTP